ncbi:MAG: carbonic anhydrase, partial [Solirubrobacterales bacterium]
MPLRGGGERSPHPQTPDEALAALLDGNARHRAGDQALRDHSPVEATDAQMPFAAVITCADSRVSPTLIFDLDRGNLFESRVAGNGIDTGALGTTEFAVAKLGVKVVMVLGHSDCRAVHAAIGIAAGTESFPAAEYGAIGQVLERVVPAIEAVPEAERDPEHCIAANARHQAARIAAA